MAEIRLRSLEVMVYRAPISTPVQTSFGVLRDRSAVLIRLTDDEGGTGWGEVWCNFPTVGAEHRARLMVETVAPLALRQSWVNPAACFEALNKSLHVLAIQSGEPGPIAQLLAGLDIAMWDLHARRENQPLWKLLGGKSDRVAVYASGLNPTNPEILASEKAAEGHRAFKLKVGFGADRDVSNLSNLRRSLGDEVTLMVDANQAWTLDEAVEMSVRLSPLNPIWLEEPIAADEPLERWRALAGRSPIPLAAGENLRDVDFERYLASGALKVIQPDVAKWGGFSRCTGLASQAEVADAWLCPHWLGAGVGLAATLQLKAAVGGPGYAEVDANPNPLREMLGGVLALENGVVTLSNGPGLGISPHLDGAERYLVSSHLVLSEKAE